MDTPEHREPSAPPIPAWAVIDTERRDTAPRRSAPIRNEALSRRARRVGGWGQEAEIGVMDLEGAL